MVLMVVLYLEQPICVLFDILECFCFTKMTTITNVHLRHFEMCVMMNSPINSYYYFFNILSAKHLK